MCFTTFVFASVNPYQAQQRQYNSHRQNTQFCWMKQQHTVQRIHKRAHTHTPIRSVLIDAAKHIRIYYCMWDRVNSRWQHERKRTYHDFNNTHTHTNTNTIDFWLQTNGVYMCVYTMRSPLLSSIHGVGVCVRTQYVRANKYIVGSPKKKAKNKKQATKRSIRNRLIWCIADS